MSQGFSIDRAQATTQIEALGHQLNSVCVRAFLPKEDKRYAPNSGRKADKLDWKQIEQWQSQGYGIYIVVNGGGHKDENITDCRAVFCEFDDRPIEDQINFWQDLGLPEPSLQIATRKSVHTYWIFDQSIAPVQWREVQTALLEYTGSDPALKNPSRVMRLAGAYHTKPGHEPLRCDIIHQSESRYSYHQLRSAIGLPEPQHKERSQIIPQSQPEFNPQSHSVKREYQRYEDILVPAEAAVPLEICLSKQSRSLLASGLREGERNVGGAKLARDLIGTANHLAALAQPFDGEPRRLLEEYANRCTPILDATEIESIWKSAQKDNPTPSCKPEGVEACIRGWYWNNYVKPSVRGNSNSQQPAQGFGVKASMCGNFNSQQPRVSNCADVGNGGSASPITAITLGSRIREILSRYESESLQINALMDLASATGRTYNDISKLAKIIRAEGDLADEVIEAVKSFQGTLTRCRKRLDIRRYIDQTLAQSLLAKAAAMPTAPEYLFNTLLATSASRIGTSARVIINPEGGYVQPCVFWTANVNHSGQAKTPPQQLILKALEEMEATAKELHDIQMEDYDSDNDAKGKPPVRMRRLLNNVTSSTKIRIHDENQRGLLEYIDELVADFGRLNQYTNGKGDDLQLELSFWNGSGCNFDRHDANPKNSHKARLFLKRTALSKTGTYQWDTLARLMADDVNFIGSGYSARFLYCSITDAPPRYLDLLSPQGSNPLKEKLEGLYRELERLPEADYLLSHEAKVLFQGWNHTLVNAEIEEQHFGLSLVYAKIESYTARIALWLHLVNAVLRGEKPLPVISGETMQHAIEIASFYLWQQKLIHAHNSPNRSLEGIFLKVQTQAEKFFTKCGKGVNASFVKTRINSLKTWLVEKIRNSIFKTLADAGHGRIEGEGSEMVYIPNHQPDDSHNKLADVGDFLVNPPIAQSTDRQGLQTMIGGIGDQFGEEKKGEGSSPIDCNRGITDSLKSLPLFSKPFLGDSDSTPPRISLDVATVTNREVKDQQQAETIEYIPIHQFTNSTAQTNDSSVLQPVGDTTKESPLPPIQVESQAAVTIDVPSKLLAGNSPHNTQSERGLLEQTQLQSWLDRIASAKSADECMDCMDALHSLPPSVSELIWKSAEPLLPRFWEILDQGLSEPGSGFIRKASPLWQQQEQGESVDRTKTNGYQKAAKQNATDHVKSLITGLWVRTVDNFYGHLSAMQADGRWWVLSPKTRNNDAQSRLYAAVDIIPMSAFLSE